MSWLVLLEGERVVAKRADLFPAMDLARAIVERRGYWVEVRGPDGVAYGAVIPSRYRAAAIMASLHQRNHRVRLEASRAD